MSGGQSVDGTGTLLRDGGCFVLARDAGGRVPLDLGRVPVDHVGKRVRLRGVRGAGGRIEVEGVAPA